MEDTLNHNSNGKIILPEVSPSTLEGCLKIFEKIKYQSYGFPAFFLDFDYKVTKQWSCAFRNPVTFDNPNTSSDEPLEACHKMLDFMRSRLKTQ